MTRVMFTVYSAVAAKSHQAHETLTAATSLHHGLAGTLRFLTHDLYYRVDQWQTRLQISQEARLCQQQRKVA